MSWQIIFLTSKLRSFAIYWRDPAQYVAVPKGNGVPRVTDSIADVIYKQD